MLRTLDVPAYWSFMSNSFWFPLRSLPIPPIFCIWNTSFSSVITLLCLLSLFLYLRMLLLFQRFFFLPWTLLTLLLFWCFEAAEEPTPDGPDNGSLKFFTFPWSKSILPKHLSCNKSLYKTLWRRLAWLLCSSRSLASSSDPDVLDLVDELTEEFLLELSSSSSISSSLCLRRSLLHWRRSSLCCLFTIRFSWC